MKTISTVIYFFLLLKISLPTEGASLALLSEKQVKEIASLLYLGSNQEPKPKSFYLTENSILEIEIQELLDKNSKDLRCQFPARYYWLSLQENLTGDFSVNHCFDNTITSPFSKSGLSTAIIFADTSNRSPMSYFGHILLGFSFDRGSPYFDHIVTFTADTSDSRSSSDVIIKGINGGFEGRFSEHVFHPIIEQYTNIEDRSLNIFELDVPNEKSILLYLHTKELQNSKYPYKFFSYNCSSEILRGIQAVNILGNDQEYLSIYPIDILKRLENKGVVSKNKATTMLSSSKKKIITDDKKKLRSVVKSESQPIFTTPRRFSAGIQELSGKYYSSIGFKLGYKGIDSPFSNKFNERNSLNFLDIEAVDLEGSIKIRKINIIEIQSLNAKSISKKTSFAWSYKTTIDRRINQKGELVDLSSIGIGIAHNYPKITITYLPEFSTSIRENFLAPTIKTEAYFYSQPFFFGIKHNTSSLTNSKLPKRTEIITVFQPLDNIQISARHELDTNLSSLQLEYFF